MGILDQSTAVALIIRPGTAGRAGLPGHSGVCSDLGIISPMGLARAYPGEILGVGMSTLLPPSAEKCSGGEKTWQ